MSDQVSVRLSVVGGAAFRQEMAAAGGAGAQAMQRLQTAAKAVPSSFNSVAVQAAQMTAQMAGASPVATALSGALGNAVAGASAFGIAGGLAAVALGTLVPLLFSGRQSAAEMAGEMVRLEGSTGAVNSAMSALTAVQREYTEATRAQGGASSASASLVIANSKAEFDARKEVLAIEIELLRIRGREQQESLTNLQDSFARESEYALEQGRILQDKGRPEPSTLTAARKRPRNAQFDNFINSNSETMLALRKLRSDVRLTTNAITEAERLMTTDFASITSGGETGSGDKGGKGGGGGQSAVNQLMEEGKRRIDATRTSAEKYAAEMAQLNELLKAGAIDQDTYNRAADQLSAQFDATAKFAADVAGTVRSSFSSLFDAIIEGGGGAGEVIEGLAKKLAAMALEQSTFGLLAQLLPSVFGSGGFVPLQANANGNAFAGGRVMAFARGGVVGGPTMFPMRGGMTGLMGEAGPEAIMPLTRIGGRLGVAAAGGGAGTVVQVVNNSGQPSRQESTRGPDGREVVKVIVGEQIASGGFDRSMRGRYGAGVQQVKR